MKFESNNRRKWTPMIILDVVMLLVVIFFGVLYRINNPIVDEANTVNEVGENVSVPNKIDFQPVIDEWTKNTAGEKSVLIYDIERDEIVGEYNPDAIYYMASLYKLFVVYDGYRRVQNGEWNENANVKGTEHTILECLDLAIRESNSDCAESLWESIGYDELDNITKEKYGTKHTDVSALQTTPNDILKIMKRYFEHPEIDDIKLLVHLRDSFLNQPTTEYDWRQGLPSGFKSAKVFNKVGWDYDGGNGIWNYYHDAAIVEFPEENRRFIIVVMTSKVPYQKISELGARVEKYFNNY